MWEKKIDYIKVDKNKMINRSSVIQANINVHSKLAKHYNHNEPHFRSENISKVKSNLEEIIKEYSEVNLLDVGCGTGFIINIVKGMCDKVYGIDATQEMLNQVEKSENVALINGIAEELPFEDGKFDVVTAYSFIHHLYSYEDALKEMYRVLKPNGTLYIDLEPNKLFWDEIKTVPDKEFDKLHDVVKREVNSIYYTGDKLQADFEINPKEFDQAEYYKNIKGGINPYILEEQLKALGFKQVSVSFEWFIGEGYYLHNTSDNEYRNVSSFLEIIQPLSHKMYKYFKVIAKK